MNMNKYHYATKGKIQCPQCGQKTLVPWVDQAGNMVSPIVGKCDRAEKCRYRLSPWEYFAENNNMTQIQKKMTNIKHYIKPSLISGSFLKNSMRNYEKNNLIRYLSSIFGTEKMYSIINRYYIGTADNGSTIFWQVDQFGRIRTGKAMKYDENGHRSKEGIGNVTWVHSMLNIPDFHLLQCLFGLHLIRNNDAPICIFESEKTAIILSYYFFDSICLATGGCQNLNAALFAPLKSRDVLLFPDNGKYEEWAEKGQKIINCNNLCITNFMETYAEKQGDDLADIVLNKLPILTEENLRKSIIKLKN